MSKPELSIILPCYNEQDNIPHVVGRFSPFWPEINFELVMVNNGSSDNTDEVLESLMKDHSFIRLVRIEENIGYGHGIFTGLKEAQGEILAYSHADIQTPPEDVIKAFHYFKKSSSNGQTLVKGLRINRREEEQFMTKWLQRISSLILGYPLKDINGQPKMFPKSFLKKLEHSPVDFSFDVFVMYKALQAGYEINTFPVDFGERIHGESKWSASIFKKYRTILGYLKNIMAISIKNFNDEHNPIKQFAKFCVVGGFGASVNYGIFYLSYKFLNIHYVAASLSGFFIAAFAIFLFNREWTFQVRHGKISKQFAQFMALMVISFTANGLSIYLFTDIIGLRAEISQLLTMAITTMINFIGSKYWVFRHKLNHEKFIVE